MSDTYTLKYLNSTIEIVCLKEEPDGIWEGSFLAASKTIIGNDFDKIRGSSSFTKYSAVVVIDGIEYEAGFVMNRDSSITFNHNPFKGNPHYSITGKILDERFKPF